MNYLFASLFRCYFVSRSFCSSYGAVHMGVDDVTSMCSPYLFRPLLKGSENIVWRNSYAVSVYMFWGLTFVWYPYIRYLVNNRYKGIKRAYIWTLWPALGALCNFWCNTPNNLHYTFNNFYCNWFKLVFLNNKFLFFTLK